MMTEVDRKKATELAEMLAKVRERLKDPAIPKVERRRLKLQRDTYAWMLQRLGPKPGGVTRKGRRHGCEPKNLASAAHDERSLRFVEREEFSRRHTVQRKEEDQAMVKQNGELTPKQARFVVEYIANGMKATRAAISAGYSEKTAQEQGSRLLSNVIVSAAIEEKTNRILGKLEITAEKVLQEIAKMAFLDPRKLFAADGSLIPIHELDDHSAASIAGLEVNELFEGQGDQKHAYGLCKKIKIADKGQNLERLGKHLKLFTSKQEVSGADGGPIQENITVTFVRTPVD